MNQLPILRIVFDLLEKILEGTLSIERDWNWALRKISGEVELKAFARSEFSICVVVAVQISCYFLHKVKQNISWKL